jgi:hypothetical protein
VPIGALFFVPVMNLLPPPRVPFSGRFWPNDTIRLKFDRAFSVDFYLFGVCLTPVELKRLISI